MTVFTMFFAFIALAAAVLDIATRRIPNWLTGALALGYILQSLVFFPGWENLAMHFAAGALVLFCGFALNAAGFMGGGDAKLLAAVVLWLGWELLVPFLLITAMAGGALAAIFLFLRAAERHPLLMPLPLPRTKESTIPYGVAISAAALLIKSYGLTLI